MKINGASWTTAVAAISIVALGLTTGCYGGTDSEAWDGESDGPAEGDDGDDGDGDGDDDGGAQARCEESKVGPPLLRRLTQAELDNTVRAVFPEIAGTFEGVSVGADTVSHHGFGNDAEVLWVAEQTARELLETAEDVADLVVEPTMLGQMLPCSTSDTTSTCAGEFVDTYGERLFHRPLTADERESYVSLHDEVATQSDFATGIRWTVVALMQSPHAVYRSELGVDDGEGGRTLTDWELAAALSYDFSGNPPDDALMAMAAAGDLGDPQTRVGVARELLATASGQETLDAFFADWLDYEGVATKTRNDVPDFEMVRAAMIEETRRTIASIVVDDKGGVADLLLSDTTAVNGALAAYYGFGGVGGDFEIVQRPENWGVGLLGQGSLLAANAHVDASSPTQRGLLVYERLLCLPRPPIPEDIPAIEPPSPGTTTTRERYEEQHMANDGCRACHRLFDPIGFAFEHFDEAGRFRADESGLAIDARGEIPKGPVAEEVAFNGLTELSETLAAQPEVTDCVSGLTATYVFGGAGGTSCLAEEARTSLADDEYGLLEYVAQLAAAPHFATRRMPSE